MLTEKELLEKYNKPVPRYTSYPPANFFHEEFTTVDFDQAIVESNDWNPENISFYFHVPYCKQLCYFCGCNSYGMRKDSSVKSYMDAMKKELQMVIGKLDKNRKVSQVHYGGGTPNAVDINYLKELNQLIFDNFELIDNAEIAIECNPAYLSKQQISELKTAGFKRFSLGIQDFEKEVLNAVNREVPFMELSSIIELLKADDPEVKVNLDFIYGLPKQSADQFARTIQKAVELKPDRLVTFSYAHVPWVSKIQKKLEVYDLPENEEKVKMNVIAREIMLKSGYKAIGMDHYALPDDELFIAQNSHALNRNFQGYCTQKTTGQVYALGVTGISQLGKVYAQNTKSIEDYIEAINKGKMTTIKGYKLSDDQVIIREAITELMCNNRVDLGKLETKFNIDLFELYKAIPDLTSNLSELIEDGVVEFNDNTIVVTEPGSLFVRNVASIFDPLIRTSGKQFSKPI